MTDAALKPATRDIVVDEIFPHTAHVLWKALTTGELMGRWLMEPTGFAAVVGQRFTYRTRPAGNWDGTIHCQVLEVKPDELLSYSWRGGDIGNVGYGAPLDTVVTFLLSPVEGGVRLRLTHAGFVSPTNDSAFATMGEGWKKVVQTIGVIAAEQA